MKIFFLIDRMELIQNESIKGKTMIGSTFTSETTQQSAQLITERFVRENERRLLTSISRSQAWQLEQKGLFPKRIKLGNRSVCWKLSELMAWVNAQERA